MYISAFTTPESIIRQLEKTDTGSLPTEADSNYAALFVQLKEYCLEVSDWFSQRVWQTFVPYYEAKTFYLTELIHDRRLRGYALTLPEALLEVDSITWLGTAVSSTYYHLLNGYRADRTPYTVIRFDPTGLSGIARDFDDAVVITGWWGYHSNYTQAFTAVETVSISDSATSLPVVSSAVYDTCQYLRIEDEMLWITALANSTTLTVTRGVNGTTAAAHTTKAAQRYNVQPAVHHALSRFVAWAYDNRSNFGVLQFSDGSAVVQEMPKYVQETLSAFKTGDIIGVV